MPPRLSLPHFFPFFALFRPIENMFIRHNAAMHGVRRMRFEAAHVGRHQSGRGRSKNSLPNNLDTCAHDERAAL